LGASGHLLYLVDVDVTEVDGKPVLYRCSESTTLGSETGE
jgi:hypothetical protein